MQGIFKFETLREKKTEAEEENGIISRSGEIQMEIK